MAKLQDRARDRASDARPYIERAFKDEKVREDVKNAIATARDVYDQLLGGRAFTAAAAKVVTDKDIQQQLRDAIERVQNKKSHSTRNTTLLLTGITLGLLFNPVTGPATRRWVQNKIFGE